ncbi:MAG: hypothetical protein IT257_06220 [Chitinophagaceae bacterium]|nr:hypothetical protein [Chitinophagaceae bacterium]
MSELSLRTNDSTQRSISILAGVIRRNSNNKWELLSDPGHHSIGLKANISEPTDSSIQVNFDKKYSRVLTCSVTADETYAQRGFVFGGSCGFDKLIIYHSKAGAPTKNSDLSIAGSNIWIQVMMFD